MYTCTPVIGYSWFAVVTGYSQFAISKHWKKFTFIVT